MRAAWVAVAAGLPVRTALCTAPSLACLCQCRARRTCGVPLRPAIPAGQCPPELPSACTAIATPRDRERPAQRSQICPHCSCLPQPRKGFVYSWLVRIREQQQVRHPPGRLRWCPSQGDARRGPRHGRGRRRGRDSGDDRARGAWHSHHQPRRLLLLPCQGGEHAATASGAIKVSEVPRVLARSLLVALCRT